MRLLFCGLVMGLVGCQHTHLRHNTVHQAKTLAEIYEQQVLDNLAKTVHDAHALPYFAYPKDGSTNISQEANIAATPFRNFSEVFGINGKRSGLEQWGLTPVSDPSKLQLMQCAYQRAVYGRPMSPCAECCEQEKSFEGKPDLKLKVYDVIAGDPLLNPATGICYQVEQNDSGLTYIDGQGNSYIVDAAGYVTLQQYDCDGPCAVNCGWLCHGGRLDVPHDCCSLVGHHCGTYVWVPKCYREHLTRLTLKILDYAVNDPAVFVKRQKEVTVSVDRFGQFTTEECQKVGTVKAIIAIDDPISSVLVVDNCAKDRAEAQLKERLRNSDVDATNIENILDELRGPLYDPTTELPSTANLSEKAKGIVHNYRAGQSSSTVTPAEPSPYVIPKQRTYHPGDSYLNPFRIQRDLNALGNQP